MSLKKGFTFVEIILAVVLLGLVAVPVLNGFYISGRSFQYAYDYYRAGLEAQTVLEQTRIFLHASTSGLLEVEDFFDLVSEDSLTAGYFEYRLRLREITGPSSMSDQIYEFFSLPDLGAEGLKTEGLKDEEALRVSSAEGLAFQAYGLRPEEEYHVVLSYDGSFTAQRDELNIFNDDTLKLNGHTGAYKVLVKISETDGAAVLRLLSGEDAYAWIDILYPTGCSASFALDALLFQGQYFLFECEAYSMKRYLAEAVVYDKDCRPMASLEKIIYAAQ